MNFYEHFCIKNFLNFLSVSRGSRLSIIFVLHFSILLFLSLLHWLLAVWLLLGYVGEHKLFLVVLQEFSRSLDINEKVVHFANVSHVYLRSLSLLSNKVRCRDQVDGVT